MLVLKLDHVSERAAGRRHALIWTAAGILLIGPALGAIKQFP